MGQFLSSAYQWASGAAERLPSTAVVAGTAAALGATYMAYRLLAGGRQPRAERQRLDLYLQWALMDAVQRLQTLPTDRKRPVAPPLPLKLLLADAGWHAQVEAAMRRATRVSPRPLVRAAFIPPARTPSRRDPW
jgi:hypothetical protein